MARYACSSITLLETHATECAQEVVQIFGGRGITKNNWWNRRISFVLNVVVNNERKRAYRGVKFDPILGGGEWIFFGECLQLLYDHGTAEVVLGDLEVREALRDMPNNVRL